MIPMHKYANPTRFLKLANRILPWSIGAMVILFGYGLYLSFFYSPEDYQQGQTVRIMYIHVPTAWISIQTYILMAVASAASIIWRHPLADIAAKSAAPIGLAFTALALITGSLWGKPMWGAWWVWDARLTSVLIQLFLYIGYISIWQAIEDQSKASRAAAILALVGIINVPIIKFSVNWWNTLHQPASIMRMGGPSIDGSMLAPLFYMFGGFMAYFITILLWRMKAELSARKLQTMKFNLAYQNEEKGEP